MTPLPTLAPAPHPVNPERSAAWQRVAFGFALLALAGGANAVDSPVLGQNLYQDTPTASGVPGITTSCLGCHGEVDNRRNAIGGSANAQISFAAALTRLQTALQNQAQMASFRAMSAQQVRDLAAYIADTPSITPTALDFSASAINTTTLPQSIDLKHAVTAGSSLQVTGITIAGTNSARFTRSADTCTSQTLAPSASCRLDYTFSPNSSAGVTSTVTINLRETAAGSTAFSRTLILTGVVASAPPPAPAPAPAAGGGGALGFGWLALLGMASAALARRRR